MVNIVLLVNVKRKARLVRSTYYLFQNTKYYCDVIISVILIHRKRNDVFPELLFWLMGCPTYLKYLTSCTQMKYGILTNWRKCSLWNCGKSPVGMWSILCLWQPKENREASGLVDISKSYCVLQLPVKVMISRSFISQNSRNQFSF